MEAGLKKRYLLNDFQPVSRKANNFSGAVREQSNLSQSEVSEDLCANAVIAIIHFTKSYARSVCTNPAIGLPDMQDDSAAFGCHGSEACFECAA
jgi:hypothetical protein